MLTIVDTGPIVAAVDPRDRNYQRCLDVLRRRDLDLVIPALVVAEAVHLIERELGPATEAAFVRGLSDFDVRSPAGSDWDRMAELIEQYSDFPLGGTDASIIALAERLDVRVIITLDRRHFGVVRPRHCDAFQLLPD